MKGNEAHHQSLGNLEHGTRFIGRPGLPPRVGACGSKGGPRFNSGGVVVLGGVKGFCSWCAGKG